ncbi:MAG TPA: CheB methylesterase domain-containing protein, partial [Clostridia bacterium]|nr:CheB methylesterase domain-containing protein [Clostridia bacterium]
HMTVSWEGDKYRVRLNQNPPLHHTRPAVDFLFDSAAASAGALAVGVLMTGMGSDGAMGMKRLKVRGAPTIAQDEHSCVVYGMPRAAVEMGVVDHVVSLDQIPVTLLRLLQKRSASAARPHPTGPASANGLHTSQT